MNGDFYAILGANLLIFGVFALAFFTRFVMAFAFEFASAIEDKIRTQRLQSDEGAGMIE